MIPSTLPFATTAPPLTAAPISRGASSGDTATVSTAAPGGGESAEGGAEGSVAETRAGESCSSGGNAPSPWQPTTNRSRTAAQHPLLEWSTQSSLPSHGTRPKPD